MLQAGAKLLLDCQAAEFNPVGLTIDNTALRETFRLLIARLVHHACGERRMVWDLHLGFIAVSHQRLYSIVPQTVNQ